MVKGYLNWVAVAFLLFQLDVTVGALAAAAVEVVDVLFDQGPSCVLHALQQFLGARHLVVSEEESQYFEAKLHGSN